jgi:hypothetical protein
MGKVAKVALPIAAIGLMIWAPWATPALAGGASVAGTAAVGGGAVLGGTAAAGGGFVIGGTATSIAATSAGLFGAGGFLGTGVSATSVQIGLAGLSAAGSLFGGMAGAQQADLFAQEEARRQRAARLQALQLEAQALKGGNAARNTAMARAAAQGQDTSGRSFMTFMADQEDILESDIDTIKVNAEAGLQTSNIRIRQFNSQRTSSLVGGATGAARSLFTAFA